MAAPQDDVPMGPLEVVKEPRTPKLLQILGPGLITGASDDDPSGIATYSQVGAQFGYGLGWVMLFSWPLMCAIQEISARIGRVTGRGIAGNLKQHYPIGRWSMAIVSAGGAPTSSTSAPTSGAMGAALKLLIGGPQLLYVAAVRPGHGPAGGVLPLFALRLGPEVADPVAVRLCRRGLRRERALGDGRL